MPNPLFFHDSRFALLGQNESSQPVQGLLSQNLLLRLLDEIDYGMILLAADGRLYFANHAARHELHSGHCLVQADGFLQTCTDDLTVDLYNKLHLVAKGKQQFLRLQNGTHKLLAVLLPLASVEQAFESQVPVALLVMARRTTHENPSLDLYAKAHGLSQVESLVLTGLCAGLSVEAIAQQRGVAESTVRSQLQSLREKTGTTETLELLQQVLTLPPLASALRVQSAMATRV